MAIYLFRCEDCDAEFTEWRSMEDHAEVPCERCEGTARRVFTSTPRVWKNHRGENVRAPGSEWVGGDTFDSTTFYQQNPGARKCQ